MLPEEIKQLLKPIQTLRLSWIVLYSADDAWLTVLPFAVVGG